jgi:hypothetical protein
MSPIWAPAPRRRRGRFLRMAGVIRNAVRHHAVCMRALGRAMHTLEPCYGLGALRELSVIGGYPYQGDGFEIAESLRGFYRKRVAHHGDGSMAVRLGTLHGNVLLVNLRRWCSRRGCPCRLPHANIFALAGPAQVCQILAAMCSLRYWTGSLKLGGLAT